MTQVFICEIIREIGEICGCFSLINLRSYVFKKKSNLMKLNTKLLFENGTDCENGSS